MTFYDEERKLAAFGTHLDALPSAPKTRSWNDACACRQPCLWCYHGDGLLVHKTAVLPLGPFCMLLQFIAPQTL